MIYFTKAGGVLEDTTKFFTCNVFLKANTKNFMQRDG